MKCSIRVGSRRIECDSELAKVLGLLVVNTDSGAVAREVYGYSASSLIAEAISEGNSGERAVMRAIALMNARNHEIELASRNYDIAGKQASAAADERRAAGIDWARERAAKSRNA